MDLRKFNESWREYKLQSKWDRLESSEVLELIRQTSAEESDLRKLLHWSVLFLMLTICLQGG